MSVNLQKGQRIDLKKKEGGSLQRVMVGLGWDEVEEKRGLFKSLKPRVDIDCDASAILCQNGKLVDFKKDVVFYNNLKITI